MRTHSALFCIALAFAVGCNKGATETALELHTAQGTLTMNGQPVKDGSVQFLPEPSQDLTVNGHVDANGKFELYTLSNGKRQKGAPPGTYTVMYMPASNTQSTKPPITTTTTYTVESGKPNEWTIELAEKK